MRDMPGQLIATVPDSGGCQDSSLPNNHSRVLTLFTPREIVGVALSDDRPHTNAEYLCHLGAILLDSLDITAEDLRRLMCKQISRLPNTFTILTKQGWPLSRNQECKAPASCIIKDSKMILIQTYYDKKRIGIVTATSDVLGFIFADYLWSISQTRDSLNDQISDIKKCSYRFLERNGWPVAAQQEATLSILDIIRPGSRIVIQYCDKSCKSSASVQFTTPPRELPVSTPVRNPAIKSSLSIKKTKKITRAKWQSLIRRDNNLVAKPILISYVRAEAADHAVNLKHRLEELGYSVYLDVHEIKTGSDWQDALNFAVSNCQVFVPLITPMYGKTQWTNREVKLADVLQKNIIPISFLEEWPPPCLAIQFASTQYIYWKPIDVEHGKVEYESRPSDLRVWETEYIKRVCKELEERCKTMVKKSQENERTYYSDVHFESSAPSERNCRSNLIVISAHPKQKVLTHELRLTLEDEGYEVWCSCDVQDSQDAFVIEEFVPPSNANTPRELSSIPESSVFGKAYNEIATTIADSKRGALPRSEFDNCNEKKAISRMISQVSDISQQPSLTPDKMERLLMFQQKAELAGVVIVIVSEAYTKSNTSKQQIFYCEHRKHVILVKFDHHPLPTWFTMLMRDDMITNVNNPQFISTLKAQVKRDLNPSSSETPKDATAEAKIQCLVSHIKKNIPQPETCVYVAGSSKLQSPRSESIARAIGKELAKVKNITLCTGGFFGAPDIVAKTFYEAIQNNRDILDDESRERLVHLLPRKDSKDFSSKTHQNPDGSFEPVTYGKTYFSGDSVKERETAVARLFDTCIVIEGGPGAAHEVEEFIWNDHFVIPIISTGGAAGGKYGVPLKIFEAPPCVVESDWSLLSEKEASPESVAQAVVNIIIALKQSIVSHINSQEENKVKSKTRNRSRKSKAVKDSDPNKLRQVSKKDKVVQTQNDVSAHGHKLLKRQVASYNVYTAHKHSRWHRFLRMFSASRR